MSKRLVPLDPETKRLRGLTSGELADEAFVSKAHIDAIKTEAIRRGLKTAEGQAGRIALSPPSTQDRSDRAVLLEVLGITETEFISRFTRPVKTDWRLTINPRRTFSGVGTWADAKPAGESTLSPKGRAAA